MIYFFSGILTLHESIPKNTVNDMNLFHSVLHSIWHWLGLYLTTHITLLTAIISISGVSFTIYRGRKTAKEKNSLDFDTYCQTNADCIKNNKIVRSICTSVMEKGKINYSLRNKVIGVYCSLPGEIAELRKSLSEKTDDRKLIENIINKKYNKELEEFEAITSILNMWERCANAIRNGIYNEKIIFDVQCRAAVLIYETFRPYIKSVQTRASSKRIFMNYEWLAKKWKLKQCFLKDLTWKERLVLRLTRKSRIITYKINNSGNKQSTWRKLSFRCSVYWLRFLLRLFRNP